MLLWLNLISFDAVITALAWQLVFCLGFCGRAPSLPEVISLATAVWLIYTADRLLDSRQLDLSRPHTLRHRFHLQHRRWLTGAWGIVFMATLFYVLACLDGSTMLAGGIVALACVGYALQVHLPRHEPKSQQVVDCGTLATLTCEKSLTPWRGKEIQVGILFAAGVTLPCWVDQPSWTLGAATMLSAVLFSVNCMIVAIADQVSDRDQGFSSVAVRLPAAGHWLPALLLIVIAASIGLALLQTRASITAASLFVSGLTTLAVFQSNFRSVPIEPTPRSILRPTGLVADGCVYAPPLLIAGLVLAGG